MRPFAFLALASLAAVPQSGSTPYAGAQRPPAELKRGFDSISEKEARGMLGFLAGSQCQGRGSGQPGFQKAAEFVAARFKAAGLKPLGDRGTYFQNATFYLPTVRNARFEIGSAAASGDAAFQMNASGRDVDVDGDVVLFRMGADAHLSAEQLAAAKGRIVVVRYPGGSKALDLAGQMLKADARACVEVVNVLYPSQERPSMYDRADDPPPVLGQITHRALAALDSNADAFLSAQERGASVLDTGRHARLSARGEVQRIPVPNVVGMVEGSDPTLKAEVVGLGAHLDHLGTYASGVTYPGADDDGSGSTAVMLIANAVAANPVKPRRSVVFMAFFGEEMGLLGSKYLVAHPPFPIDKMVAELQMDMVGRDSEGKQNGDPSRVDRREENVDTMRLVGSRRISTDLDRSIQDMNRYVGFRFKYDSDDVYRRSDHYSFAVKGIPVAFLFDGFHPDYHRSTDTVDKIDWTKLTNAARLYYLVLMKVANDPVAPRKDVPPEGPASGR